eukprot:7377402-Prymnesium_polylepis.2
MHRKCTTGVASSRTNDDAFCALEGPALHARGATVCSCSGVADQAATVSCRRREGPGGSERGGRAAGARTSAPPSFARESSMRVPSSRCTSPARMYAAPPHREALEPMIRLFLRTIVIPPRIMNAPPESTAPESRIELDATTSRPPVTRKAPASAASRDCVHRS